MPTNRQLVDAAVTELKQVTTTYAKARPWPPGPNTHWGRALNLLSQVTDSTPMTKLGVCKLYAAAGSVAQFGITYDCKIDYAADFLGYYNWGAIEGQDAGQLGTWNSFGKPLDLAVCPWPSGSGGTLAQGAAGAYDYHFADLALVLGALSIPVVVRFAWESTAYWMEWDCGKDAQKARDYATYFARVATILKHSPNVKMCWCPQWGNQNLVDPLLSYPGDAAVDFIASDVYDHAGIEGLFVDPSFKYSGVWFANFAAERGKPFCITEWGLQNRDRPAFISEIHDFIGAYCDGGYHVYSDYSAADGNHLLSSFPLAAQRFKELF